MRNIVPSSHFYSSLLRPPISIQFSFPPSYPSPFSLNRPFLSLPHLSPSSPSLILNLISILSLHPSPFSLNLSLLSLPHILPLLPLPRSQSDFHSLPPTLHHSLSIYLSPPTPPLPLPPSPTLSLEAVGDRTGGVIFSSVDSVRSTDVLGFRATSGYKVEEI